ncbi:MAG TPA: ATP-binding protein [Ferruginibacter sp.]|nr:ATP-binding protein [Ferruginibacter sp.]
MQNHRIISRAIIKAEEKERNRLGAELHDNVNQLLVSARLYIGLQKKKPNNNLEYLDKADEYLSIAIEEIRELTRRLTTPVITNEGLQNCMEEIAGSMLLLKNIHLQLMISDDIVIKLSIEQQLMIYRIIQEQTSNILKYAETTAATISLQEINGNVELIITDYGKGFDRSQQKTNGIGFTNIFNRVDAYNGTSEIISSPGNGCKLIITFPLIEG